MKKLTSFLLAITSLALVFALIGCSNGGDFTSKEYTSSNIKIEAVNIDVRDREITVSVSNDDQIHIDYFESEKEYYDISVSENNILKMEFLQNKELADFIGTKPSAEYRKINLKIPLALLSDLSISTTNETIILLPIMVSNSITLSTNGGNIEFEKIDVGKALTVTTKNGNIIGTIKGGYDAFSISCKIKKGQCNLPLEKTDGEKSLSLNCNNGDIKVDFVKK